MKLWIKLYNNKSTQSSYVNEFTNAIINHIFGNYTDAKVIILCCIVAFSSSSLARKNGGSFADRWNKEQVTIWEKEWYKYFVAELLN